MPPTHAPVVIPGELVVERDPYGTTRVLVDGEPLPYAFDTNAGVHVRVADDTLPAIILTLVAKTVRVVDARGDDGEGPVTHEHPATQRDVAP